MTPPTLQPISYILVQSRNIYHRIQKAGFNNSSLRKLLKRWTFIRW